MENSNTILTDQHLRDLLKWRLLKQEEESAFTNQLNDMEATLVFKNEALVLPPLKKENEFLNRSIRPKNKYGWLKWLIIMAVAVGICVFCFSKRKNPAIVKSPVKLFTKNVNAPEQPVNSVGPTDSIFEKELPQQNTTPVISAEPLDSIHTEKETAWTYGSAGIQDDYKPVPHQPKFVYKEENIPSLSEKEIEANNKAKDKMIRQLIRKDKSAWTFVPLGTDVFYGKTVSMYAFYMATTEVSNKQYRVFLNDLLINGRTDDYLLAVPDTEQWMIGNSKFYEPMRKNYFWHPAYDNYPVLNVSREGAKLYCNWLTIETNKRIKEEYPKDKNVEQRYINDVRLPHETEWMMAARGGTSGNGDYPWTVSSEKTNMRNSKGCYLCNYSLIGQHDTMKSATCIRYPDSPTSAGAVSHDCFLTAPVDSYNPNAYGLYNMSGNAAEMVILDDISPAAKGGSWFSNAQQVRIDAPAEFVGNTKGSPYVGFRPVFSNNVVEKNDKK